MHAHAHPPSAGEAEGSLFWFRLQSPAHTPYFDQQLTGFKAKHPNVEVVGEDAPRAEWGAKIGV